MCEICQHWASTGKEARWTDANGKLVATTNHHVNCPHYNDSLIDVWKVIVDGVSCYVDNEQDAKDTAGDNEDMVKIEREKMHREIFEHLPEFEGF